MSDGLLTQLVTVELDQETGKGPKGWQDVDDRREAAAAIRETHDEDAET
jgi:hypothetical protein